MNSGFEHDRITCFDLSPSSFDYGRMFFTSFEINKIWFNFLTYGVSMILVFDVGDFIYYVHCIMYFMNARHGLVLQLWDSKELRYDKLLWNRKWFCLFFFAKSTGFKVEEKKTKHGSLTSDDYTHVIVLSFAILILCSRM